MTLKKSVAVFFSLSLSLSPAWAVSHVVPGTYPNHKQDMIHHPSDVQMRKFGSMHAAIIGGSTGSHNVAVIIVQFPAGNASLRSGSNSIVSLANIDTYFANMKSYYNEVSYTKLQLSFSFFGQNTVLSTGNGTAQASGAYTLAQPMEYYGCGDEGVGCGATPTPTPGVVGANGDVLIADALTKANGLTGGPKSPTAGGAFDAVIVLHAGNGNETTQGRNGDIWSIFYSQDTAITATGAGFTEGDVDPETETSGVSSPLGVMCHEMGHELGLPDLYNTVVSGGASVVGNWELMDSGPYDGPPGSGGTNPSHMGAWDKIFLNWATPQIITSKGNFSQGYVETPPSNIWKLPVQNSSPNEYFLVENRSRSSGALYDRNLPGDGLLVWHVDDDITSTHGIAASNPNLQNTVNTKIDSNHFGVSIVPADGIAISNSNQGDSGNPFTSQVFQSHQSDNFAGQVSGIVMANISGAGSSKASADIANYASGASQNILKIINFPNPAGKGYSHPKGEGYTTIQFWLARPAQDWSINIYTLSADLVKKIVKDDIHLQLINRSSDEKFVYEYDWDLTNGNGAHVAPGVYLYLVRADGESKSGKIVVIR